MQRLKSYILSGATLMCALGIGYVMQYGFAAPGGMPKSKEPLIVSDVTLTSSAAIPIPRLPVKEAAQAVLPDNKVELAAADTAEPEILKLDNILPQEPAASGFGCDIALSAMPDAGAMVSLTLNAPCHASERITLHHSGLMFTEVLQPDGTLQVSVPAMAESAEFAVAFSNGDGATASVQVSSLSFYDRVAVQWQGDTGLQLHAREYTEAYFADGHIWSAATGDVAAAAKGKGGFLTRLGQVDSPNARLVEVYSFPSGTAKQPGNVHLSVEAEITAANCDGHIEAQTLELRGGEGLRVRDLSLEVPDCKSIGDFLVLKNLVEDLKIASN